MANAVDTDFVAFQSVLAGEYSLERELGRGGMGIVYLAREVRLDRHVAIKLLPPALAARGDLRERFLREARTAAKLSHPNIAPIHRVDELSGFVFFVMAHVDGETLAQRVRARGPLAAGDAVRLLREVAWALAYAHLHGVVHRDVKPDNILIERETGRAVVTDFGIAQVEHALLQADAGLVMGTAHYMSPEQAVGRPLDGRSDLYSLGVVAYYALSGSLPFDAPTPHAVLAKHVHEHPRSVALLAPTAPRQLAEAVDRCLAKDPALRFATGEALAAALEAERDQRRVIPAPLRLWLTRRSVGRPALFLFAYMFGGPIGMAAGPVVGLAIFLGVPLVGSLLITALRARRALAFGYRYEDLLAALREQLEWRREELRYELGPDLEPTAAGRFVRRVTVGSFAVMVASIGMIVTFPWLFRHRFVRWHWLLLGASFTVTVAGAFVGAFLPGRSATTDRRLEWRLRFWESRFGRWVASIAAKGLRQRAVPALSHAPTELVIGTAASELFRALPRETQKELPDFPRVIRRLEDDAQAIRQRLALLDVRLREAAAAGRERDAPTATYSEAATALGSEREEANRRLATVVAALETIRLDLLRLHGGTGSIASLTTAIEAAAELGSQVDLLVESRRSAEAAVERLLGDASLPEAPTGPQRSLSSSD